MSSGGLNQRDVSPCTAYLAIAMESFILPRPSLFSVQFSRPCFVEQPVSHAVAPAGLRDQGGGLPPPPLPRGRGRRPLRLLDDVLGAAALALELPLAAAAPTAAPVIIGEILAAFHDDLLLECD